MIHIEPKTLTIRGGDNFKKYGDPYDFCLSVFIDGDSAHIFGLCGKFSYKEYAQVRDELVKNYGIKTAHWERKKKNKTKPVLWINKQTIAP